MKNHMKLGKADMSLRIVAYVFTILFLIMLLFPIYWLFTTSTKDVMQSYETPPEMFPTMPYTYEVYLEVPDGYTAEDFREDSAYLAWPVANECTNRRFAGLRIMAGHNGMIQYKCEISSSDFKLYKSELFPGAVSVNIIRNTMEKVLSVMDREKMFSLNSAGVYTQRGGNEYSDAVEADLNRFAEEASIKATVSSVGTQRSFSGMFSSYVVAWLRFETSGYTFFRFVQNSLIISIAGVLLQWLLTGMFAYAMARLVSAKTSRILMVFAILTMMIPSIVIVLPLYGMIERLQLKNNLIAVILPAVPSAMNLFLFKNFFEGIPNDLNEAARVDGASELRIFFQLYVPLSVPIFSVVAMLTFTGAWNEFFWPSLVLNQEPYMTLPVIINALMNAPGSSGLRDYPLSMAMSVIAAVPIFIVFLFFQKYLTEGMVFTGLKG